MAGPTKRLGPPASVGSLHCRSAAALEITHSRRNLCGRSVLATRGAGGPLPRGERPSPSGVPRRHSHHFRWARWWRGPCRGACDRARSRPRRTEVKRHDSRPEPTEVHPAPAAGARVRHRPAQHRGTVIEWPRPIPNTSPTARSNRRISRSVWASVGCTGHQGHAPDLRVERAHGQLSG